MVNKLFATTSCSFILSILMISNGFAFDFLFSNRDYADRITVQARIASFERLSDLIANKDSNLNNIPAETNKFLKKTQPHLFIRIKNHGNAGAWGTLSCNIDNQYLISLDVKLLGAGMSLWQYYVTPIKRIMLLENNDAPKVITKWAHLYSK